MIREETEAGHEEPIMLRNVNFILQTVGSPRVSNTHVFKSDCVFVCVYSVEN